MPRLCEDAGLIARRYIKDSGIAMGKFLGLTESPVEQMFAAAAFDFFDLAFDLETRSGNCSLINDDAGVSGLFVLTIKPQAVFLAGDEEYRSDLLIYLSRGERSWGHLVVEIDGHDYHERTHWQASRDRKRDRDLLAKGYVTVRFTGSDVYRNPYRCVDEVYQLMSQNAASIVNAYEARGDLAELIFGKDAMNTACAS